jgi:hypothetical protein
MKTTSYEISKKLAEAGFKAETEWYHDLGYGTLYYNFEADKYNNRLVPTYDLETILEALPDLIRSPDSPPHLYPLFVSKKGVGYDYTSGLTSIRKGEESLADCAAKMLILLHEKGLINFN